MKNNINFSQHVIKKFPHSWIFHGPKGIGKYKFTIEFIKNFNKTNNSNNNIF